MRKTAGSLEQFKKQCKAETRPRGSVLRSAAGTLPRGRVSARIFNLELL
jgi:hypothetical protein